MGFRNCTRYINQKLQKQHKREELKDFIDRIKRKQKNSRHIPFAATPPTTSSSPSLSMACAFLNIGSIY